MLRGDVVIIYFNNYLSAVARHCMWGSIICSTPFHDISTSPALCAWVLEGVAFTSIEYGRACGT